MFVRAAWDPFGVPIHLRPDAADRLETITVRDRSDPSGQEEARREIVGVFIRPLPSRSALVVRRLNRTRRTDGSMRHGLIAVCVSDVARIIRCELRIDLAVVVPEIGLLIRRTGAGDERVDRIPRIGAPQPDAVRHDGAASLDTRLADPIDRVHLRQTVLRPLGRNFRIRLQSLAGSQIARRAAKIVRAAFGPNHIHARERQAGEPGRDVLEVHANADGPVALRQIGRQRNFELIGAGIRRGYRRSGYARLTCRQSRTAGRSCCRRR